MFEDIRVPLFYVTPGVSSAMYASGVTTALVVLYEPPCLVVQVANEGYTLPDSARRVLIRDAAMAKPRSTEPAVLRKGQRMFSRALHGKPEPADGKSDQEVVYPVNATNNPP